MARRKRRTAKKIEEEKLDVRRYPLTVEEAVKSVPEKAFIPTVSIDFDGVIHAYRNGWTSADVVDDVPTFFYSKRSKSKMTSIHWITQLVLFGMFRVAIFSNRNTQEGGIEAMKKWLLDNGMDKKVLEQIVFPTEKPKAIVHVDDRVLPFTGRFFTPHELINFVPWKQPSEDPKKEEK